MAHKKLYRDTQRGRVGGVCAGLANYFGWEVWLVRILAVAALLLAFKLTFIAYIVAWILLDKQVNPPQPSPLREETRNETLADGRVVEVKTRVWESGQSPREALSQVTGEFAELERTVARLECYVTSEQYRLKQAFKQL